MSDAARNQVWRSSHHTNATFLVALAVADVVNDTHNNEFFMSIDTLAQKTRLSRRTVLTALAELETDGWLLKLQEGVGRGNHVIYQWVFIDDLPVVYETQKKGAKSAPFKGSEKVQSTTEKVQNLHILDDYTNSLLTERTEVTEVEKKFNEFWEVYPRKDKKKLARILFAKIIKTTNPDVIIEGAKTYAKAQEGKELQYVAMATSWLNAERWLDVPVAKPKPVTPVIPAYKPEDYSASVPMPEDVRALLKDLGMVTKSVENDF